ncbi:penicillin-binding protein activator [Enterobacteriaceae bacterium YMB-R22]|jgi:outer membrane PBP1 activator LpoA protein|uniref:penicillin-binding protein activator n=1 Tax=Tenebrionicola larvae TaxID=2815733 RepID=UPI0020132121|nr:penicillin-binding protein activator [Tenebrionicola larvae]MBV4413653.1 penicillin-binding protein activator [Tenebrionicola larvae]
MVPSKIFRSKAGRCLPVLLAAMLFSGCGIQSKDQSASLLQADTQGNSAFYLQQMQQSRDDNRTNWQLLAIRALLKEGNNPQAIELYGKLPHGLSGQQGREYALLSAEIALLRQDYAGARTRLASINPDELEAPQQARYWQLQINASQGKPSLSLLRALIAQEPSLQGDAKQKNIDATWQALSAMSEEQARALVINARENTLQGWLDLQQIWFSKRNNLQALKAGIADWRIRYPQNPGATMLPGALNNLQNAHATTNIIALLLPLNGQAGVFGQALKRGFEDARNGLLQTSPSTADTQPTPAYTETPNGGDVVSPANAPVDELLENHSSVSPLQADPQPTPAASAAQTPAEVRVYDTTEQPVSQILAQAQRDGASLVVGPLLKPDVERMLTSNTPLNVLALNQPGHISNRANVCYFALSPEDEARDAAEHIWAQGYRRPLLLAPGNALGDRVTRAFANAWQQQGGDTVLQQRFGTQAELRSAINRGTGLTLTGTPVTTEREAPALADNASVPAQPLEAQDTPGNVDAVYIVATRSELALIKPMIAMRTGSRSSVQLYASSRSAQSGAGADFRLEMEGLEYSEIPALSGSNPAFQQQALAASRNDYSLARLYAMGADAWTLANQFVQIRQMPGHQIAGNTGTLIASDDCVIGRKMSWLKYQQGRIVAVN